MMVKYINIFILRVGKLLYFNEIYTLCIYNGILNVSIENDMELC